MVGYFQEILMVLCSGRISSKEGCSVFGKGAFKETFY